MGKLTADALLDLVRSSGLVEKDQLNAVLSAARQEAGSPPIEMAEEMANRLVAAKLLTRWQADRLLEGRHKGFFLGKYKLLDHLGTGGMSSVYLAEHVLMQRRVAIKVLPKNRVADTSYLARFHREAQAAATLDHRNIVRVYDVDNDGNVHYLVMEYIEGRDVQRIVKEDGPLDYATAADYTRQAAEGLSHAHKAGLIHRDVKPANLLVDHKKTVKVLDLGLARFADEKTASLTVAYDENILGTADYLPPEQAVDSHRVDCRADIYGLGCSLYFMLTGHPPFPKGTLPQRLMMHQKETPPSILDDRPDAPADLLEICAKMMAKKPQQRYQSAAELARALTIWQVAHGHATGSSVGSSASSARLVGVVSNEATAERESPSGVRRPAKGGNVVRHRVVEGGTPRRSPVMADGSPSFIDTSSDLLRPTVKGPGTGSPAKASGGSGKRTLPVAERLQSPASEYVIDDELPSAISRVRSPSSLKGEELAPHLIPRKADNVNKWFWAVVAVGGALAVILLAIIAWLTWKF